MRVKHICMHLQLFSFVNLPLQHLLKSETYSKASYPPIMNHLKNGGFVILSLMLHYGMYKSWRIIILHANWAFSVGLLLHPLLHVICTWLMVETFNLILQCRVRNHVDLLAIFKMSNIILLHDSPDSDYAATIIIPYGCWTGNIYDSRAC